MGTPQISNIVNVKIIESVKTRRRNGRLQSMGREYFRNMLVPSEITGKIEKIEDGQYFVSVGDYVDDVFKPSGRTITFTQIYMLRFARILG